MEDEYHLLVQSATVWRVGLEMSKRQLGSHDVFHVFNTSRDGMLSCGELGSGLAWLGLPVSEADLHALVQRMDRGGDGMTTGSNPPLELPDHSC